MDENGQLVDDFVIEQLGRVTALRNAPSPGATSALAIAEHLAQKIDETMARFTGGASKSDVR